MYHLVYVPYKIKKNDGYFISMETTNNVLHHMSDHDANETLSVGCWGHDHLKLYGRMTAKKMGTDGSEPMKYRKLP